MQVRELIYREGRLFKINRDKLPEMARTVAVTNKLFIAIFREFQGASENEKYSSFSYKERLELVNKYAKEWLLKQGYK